MSHADTLIVTAVCAMLRAAGCAGASQDGAKRIAGQRETSATAWRALHLHGEQGRHSEEPGGRRG